MKQPIIVKANGAQDLEIPAAESAKNITVISPSHATNNKSNGSKQVPFTELRKVFDPPFPLNSSSIARNPYLDTPRLSTPNASLFPSPPLKTTVKPPTHIRPRIACDKEVTQSPIKVDIKTGGDLRLIKIVDLESKAFVDCVNDFLIDLRALHPADQRPIIECDIKGPNEAPVDTYLSRNGPDRVLQVNNIFF